MQMCKAKNASHIRTASTAAAEYPKAKTTNRRLHKIFDTTRPFIVCFSNRFCFLETLWCLLRGRFRAAFRRLSGVALVKCGERTVKVEYPTLREVMSLFSPSFHMRSCIGLGIAVPSSYLEPILRKYPRVLCLLRHIDRRICHLPFVRAIGDHMLLHFERLEG